ncbi:MAG: glycosyl transferase family 9 [Candidatus Cloacimonetes bacterium HGW-Cloacimonetes-1]|jgi:lipopolysaccharide heptosyltransferase II|nr:MAG: glycosyl transferase family 9 [Candidatus Cloacimonetes bacterium HGW-Cloacimonetes-1]
MKILVIRLSSLGDIVLTQSVCAELREHYPSSIIEFLTYPAFRDLVQSFGTCDKIISYEKTLAFHLKLMLQRYDMIVDLHQKLSTIIVRTLLRAPRKVVYQKKRQLRNRIVKHRTAKSILSTVSLYYSVFTAIPDMQGLTLESPKKPVIKAIGDLPPCIAELKSENRLLIGIFPGAAHQTKMYPIDQWNKVIGLSDANWHFVLLGSKNEGYLCKELEQSNPERTTNLCGRFQIGDLIAVINGLDLVLSNDSGPMHLAAALQKAQIAIFGSVHPKLGFAPLNDRAIVLCADLDCQPCSLHGRESCPLGHFRCMTEISPESIVRSISLLLGRLDRTY